jgi:DNA-binding MarR family transcriptional regulator
MLCQLIEGPVGMADLGRQLHLEKSSLTGLVDRAERRGLVTRVRNSCDRRAYQVALTDEGTQLAVETHRVVCEELDKVAAVVPGHRPEAADRGNRADRHRLITGL